MRALQQRFPAIQALCDEETYLPSSFAANLDGDRFVKDPTTRLVANTNVLIMSADAGG
jgi:hypothetical protein